MTLLSLLDRSILAATNGYLYLRHPLFIRRYRQLQHRWPNLAAPGTLSDLVQWRKLFDHNPLFPILSDKIDAKAWAASRLPGVLIPETLWTGKRPEDVPQSLITAENVIKTNNASSQNYFPSRQGTDRARFEQQFKRWMRGPFATWFDRVRTARLEWAYTSIERKILVERSVGESPVDIAIRAVDGVAVLASCATAYKTKRSRVGYFWPDGRRVAAPVDKSAELDADFTAPPQMAEAATLARQLSVGFDYLRVDFLVAENRLYLGEITLYPASGHGSDSWRTQAVYHYWLAALHKSWVLSTPQPWLRRLYLSTFRRWRERRLAELGPPQKFLVAHGAQPGRGRSSSISPKR